MMRIGISKRFESDQPHEFVHFGSFFAQHTARNQASLDVAANGEPRETDSDLEKQDHVPRSVRRFFLRRRAARRYQENRDRPQGEVVSISHNRSAQLKTPARQRRWKMKYRPARGGLCPARPAPQNFCRLGEREGLTRPRHRSSPLDYSLLPD